MRTVDLPFCNSLVYIFVNWLVLSFAHEEDVTVFRSADMQDFDHFEYIFCLFYDVICLGLYGAR